MTVEVKPSDIFYSQDSIGSCFSNGNNLGKVLDDICEGRLEASDFPRLEVAKRDGKYFTTCNRRLWLFRQLERLGKCGEIPVIEISSIRSDKLTTGNGGTEVEIRGTIEGTWEAKPDCPMSQRRPPYLCKFSGSPKYLPCSPRYSRRRRRRKRRRHDSDDLDDFDSDFDFDSNTDYSDDDW